jgi:hypothetical protein
VDIATEVRPPKRHGPIDASRLERRMVFVVALALAALLAAVTYAVLLRF